MINTYTYFEYMIILKHYYTFFNMKPHIERNKYKKPLKKNKPTQYEKTILIIQVKIIKVIKKSIIS